MDFEFPINKKKLANFTWNWEKLVKITLDPFFSKLKKTKKKMSEKNTIS